MKDLNFQHPIYCFFFLSYHGLPHLLWDSSGIEDHRAASTRLRRWGNFTTFSGEKERRCIWHDQPGFRYVVIIEIYRRMKCLLHVLLGKKPELLRSWLMEKHRCPLAQGDKQRSQKSTELQCASSIPFYPVGVFSLIHHWIMIHPPLVGGLEHDFHFSIYWECHNPNWRTPSFFRGVGQPPTSPLFQEGPFSPWRLRMLLRLLSLHSAFGFFVPLDSGSIQVGWDRRRPGGERCVQQRTHWYQAILWLYFT